MATLSATFVQALARSNPDRLARTFHASLVGSYRTLTIERVRDAIDHWLAGQKAEGIIEMFVFGWLDDGVDD